MSKQLLESILKWLRANRGAVVIVVFFAILLGVIVDHITAPKENVQQCTYSDTYEREEECKAVTPSFSAEERLAEYTFWLTMLTAALVGVSAWQGYLILRAERSTREALANSKKQTDAIINSERPFVFVEVTESGVEVGDRGVLRFAAQRMNFEFVNYGKTIAMLHELVEEYPVVEGIIDAPPPIDPLVTRGRRLPDGTVCAQGSPHSLTTTLMNMTNVTRLYQSDAWNTCRLWFYGYVRFSDTFGTHYVKGFMFVFRPTHNRWVLRGGEPWNYTRIETPADIPLHPHDAE